MCIIMLVLHLSSSVEACAQAQIQVNCSMHQDGIHLVLTGYPLEIWSGLLSM